MFRFTITAEANIISARDIDRIEKKNLNIVIWIIYLQITGWEKSKTVVEPSTKQTTIPLWIAMNDENTERRTNVRADRKIKKNTHKARLVSS